MDEQAGSLLVAVHDGDPPLIKLSGQADFHNRDRIMAAFASARDGGSLRVQADLSELHYIDTSALSTLIACATMLAEQDGCVEITAVSHQVSRVLNMCGAADLFASTTGAVLVSRDQSPRPPSESYWHVSDFSLPASPEAGAAARRRVALVVRALPFSLADADDVLAAVGEALANAIRHGCGCDPELRVSVRCIAGPSRVAIEVTDPGPGFDPEAVASCPRPSMAEGGMGLSLMRDLMDEVSFTFDGGTTARLVKSIPAAG